MLRNWLILVSEENQLRQVQEYSSYKAVQILKEVRVSLLSGEYSGVVVLSILDSDSKGFTGFISGLKNHPDLKKVQVVLLDNLKSLFSADDQKDLRFFSIGQIGKLIDLDFNSGNLPTEERGQEEFSEDSSPQVVPSSKEVSPEDRTQEESNKEISPEEASNEVSSIKKIEVKAEILNADNLEFLKHICATAMVNMVLEGELDGDRGQVLEVLSRRVLEGY